MIRRIRSQIPDSKRLVFAVVLALLTLTTVPTRADVELEGAWPEDEVVTLSVQRAARADAVRQLSDEAGWSLIAPDLGEDHVDVLVKEQPASDVLRLLLEGGDYVVNRDGDLVAIRRAQADAVGTERTGGAAAVVEAVGDEARDGEAAGSPANPEKAVAKRRLREKGQDVVVTDDVRIEAEEVVKDVIVWGGDLVVEGTVTGGIGVFGGSAKFVEGSYVAGDVAGFGSSVEIENGAQIDGEVGVLGGSLRRGDQVEVECSTCGDDEEGKSVAEFLEDLAGRITAVSLLWVFGAIVLALAMKRAELVRHEIAARPLRCVGLGFAGSVVVLVVIGALAITLIGIPLAVLTGLLTALLGYLGFGIALLAVGSRLLAERSENPYLHLAAGCGVYLVVASIPFVGAIVSFLVGLAGLGGLVASRLAGFVPRREVAEAS